MLGRAPGVDEVGERLMRLARRSLGRAVVDASARRITLQLHPGASPATLTVLPDGDLELRAETGSIGPGYHAHVLAQVGSLLDELDYGWVDDPPDLAAIQAQMCEWVSRELRAGATRIGMPVERSFRVEAAVQTAMGPRDAAWRARVLACPVDASDTFAWWGSGPGHAERARALHAMWHEVPWREPLDDDELALLRGVDADLRAARKADSTLPLPYADWAELLEWIGEDARARKARERSDGATATIGYRRWPMDIEVSGGWTVVLSGAFVAHAEADGRWWATDGDRAVELLTFTAGDELDSAALLAIAPEAHLVRERFADGPRRGRMEVYEEGDVHVMHGLVAHAPHVAILTCKSHLRDEAWAIAAWRSLVNDAA